MSRSAEVLERAARALQSIAELARDCLELDIVSPEPTLEAIRALATLGHDELDAELRRCGDPGRGFLNPILAAQDDERAAQRAAS